VTWGVGEGGGSERGESGGDSARGGGGGVGGRSGAPDGAGEGGAKAGRDCWRGEGVVGVWEEEEEEALVMARRRASPLYRLNLTMTAVYGGKKKKKGKSVVHAEESRVLGGKFVDRDSALVNRATRRQYNNDNRGAVALNLSNNWSRKC